MKNFGKISLAAGLAAALFVLLRKRKDGTRILDDVTHQISEWANTLMQARERLSFSNDQHAKPAAPRTAPRTTATASARQPGDIQE